MTKKDYKPTDVELAHRWAVKSIDTLEEARVLLPSGQTRAGAYSRLYYSAFHVAVALLRLIGSKAKKHGVVISEFGKEWVKKRSFPPKYGHLLNSLYDDRLRADYGEYVPTMQRDLERLLKEVQNFIRRYHKEIPPVSTAKILTILVHENPEIRDFSFDIYCPKSYYHHTRFTVWGPKGRVTDSWLRVLLNSTIKTIKALRIKDPTHYVLGLNSRINQYAEKHLIMLDFDNISTIQFSEFKGEPGFFFRTGSGFDFIGSKLYDRKEWKKKMRQYSKIASKQHFDLSMKRGYATLRLTASPRNP